MVPLIKLVHPDLFAQYPPDVAKTNSKSLQVKTMCVRICLLREIAHIFVIARVLYVKGGNLDVNIMNVFVYNIKDTWSLNIRS